MQTNQNQSIGNGHAAEVHEDYGQNVFISLSSGFSDESFNYHNVASCPDCESGMVRQGRCCTCPSCGFSSCG